MDWFFPVTNDYVLIKEAVKMILSTRFYDRVHRPDIGSAVHELPFEQNDAITIELFRKNVVSAIQNFEPRVDVMGVDFKIEDHSQTMFLTLKMKSSFNTEPVTFSLPFQQREV
jgi:phage baseplate assembly protein W